MNNRPQPSLRAARRSHPAVGGHALILTLAALVLCALMIIILLERVNVGARSSSAYSRGIEVRTLADMSVRRVQAQIKDATTINQTTETPIASRDTWASQPGAIRTYAPNGDLRGIYKLYSAEEMLTTNTDLSGDIPDNWHTRPREFTDLNQPVGDVYPILNPNVADLVPDAIGITEGFEILDDAPLASGDDPNEAPMPVRWIYVLEDGTLCHLGDPRINLRENPIVGRIAFWADDETAKVNINTASPVTEQSFWDAPRARSLGERNQFSLRQPAQNEYQRYPGHPAMVSLRSILGDLSLSPPEYFDLTPRYRWGGSEEGDIRIDQSRVSLLRNKEDRVYVTLDELLFDSIGPGEARGFLPQDAGVFEFFLTASSRAPELNLFGQPRVSIWPVWGNQNSIDPGEIRRTSFDRLIAFNSTIGGKAYYFAREQPFSSTHDFSGIARNQALYAYLQRLTAVSVPAFSGAGSFAIKYQEDRDQILTQIFDYIRTTNLNETFRGRAEGFLSYTPDWDGGTIQNIAQPYVPGNTLRGAGLVVPIEIGETRGLGRFPVVTEIGLLFIVRSEFRPSGPPDFDPPEPPHPDNREMLEAMLVMETVTPAFGYMPWCGNDIEIELESSTVGMQVEGRVQDLFPAGVIGVNERPIYWPPAMQEGLSPGGYDGAGYLYGRDGTQISGNAANVTPYRFFSPPLALDSGDSEFLITGGELKINLRVGGGIVQSYTVNFPSTGNLPLPTRISQDYGYNWNRPTARPWWQSRFNVPLPRGPSRDDVLQSVELSHGDARLIAGMREVPASAFVPHQDYGSTRFAHGLRATQNGGPAAHWEGGTNGTYVDLPLASGPYSPTGQNRPPSDGLRQSAHPKIRSSITDLRAEGWSADFDNGFGGYLDGSFTNKPDEGMLNITLSGGSSVNPYESYRWTTADGLFSPLRQVPSPVMFGSLPTGVKAGIPWRTLLFCPNPADPNHFGINDPADHLLLDLFRMPVVEPWSISGPASTDGKINLNFGLAPFSYIRRASSWYALLEPLKLFAIPDSQSQMYKSANHQYDYRSRIDISQTLEQFEERFAANDIFKSATEICSIFLVPEGATLAAVRNLDTGFWSTHRLTGDNSREKPYAELYPKLTTQSNTFRIHMRVQVLARNDGTPAGGAADFLPLAEYRGSRLIERYLPPDSPRFNSGPDQVDPDEDNLNELYRFRILEARQFNP